MFLHEEKPVRHVSQQPPLLETASALSLTFKIKTDFLKASHYNNGFGLLVFFGFVYFRQPAIENQGSIKHFFITFYKQNH